MIPWGYLKADNTITLNGQTYTYYPNENKLNNIDLENDTATVSNEATFNGVTITTTYKIVKLTDGIILEIHYNVVI